MQPSDSQLRWWQNLSRKQWLLFIAATLAWFFDCLDGQLFNLARDAAMEDLLGDRTKATIYSPYTTSIFLLGWAAGGLVFGALGDRYGRARMLMWSVIIYSLCTGLSSFSTGFWDFCAYRFLTGIGVGGVFGLAVALVADSFPERSRAPALGLLNRFPRGAIFSPVSSAWASERPPLKGYREICTRGRPSFSSARHPR